MIRISGSIIEPNTILEQYPSDSIERKTAAILSSSSKVYDYVSLQQLNFELSLRKNIIKASLDLNNSNFSFRTFRNSFCNTEFWNRSNEGGFLLKNRVSAYNAVRDIYFNSSLYGTECSTAIVILYYKALLETIPQDLFNRLFPKIYLMDWQHLDRKLGINQDSNPADYLPGDCRYFKNPDVDPMTPEWQGENVIDLGNGTFYGHGIGISTAAQIIETLNRLRISGSQISAYLSDSVTNPGYRLLADIYHSS